MGMGFFKTTINSTNPQKTRAAKKPNSTSPKKAQATKKPKADWKNISIEDGIGQELKDPFGLVNLAMCLGSRITSEAIPAFKEEGAIQGIKATGKAIVAGFAAYFGDVGFSVAFRKLGAIAGFAVAGNAGAGVGSFIGNLAGGIVSNAIVQKIFPYKENKTATTENSTPKENSSDEENLSLDEKVAQERLKEQENTSANEETKTASFVSKNPYNSKIEYVTEDGVTIYEKPNINMKTYLASNPDKIPYRRNSNASKCNFLA